jgi:hypothetical protein
MLPTAEKLGQGGTGQAVRRDRREEGEHRHVSRRSMRAVGMLFSGCCAPSSRLPFGRLRRHGLQSEVVDHAAHSAPKK